MTDDQCRPPDAVISDGTRGNLFPMDSTKSTRREVLTTAAAAFTTSLFTGKVKGANDRVAVGYIGLGAMGSGNLGYGMKVPEIQVAALCDVYAPHLERAQDAARKG